jgi:hypothetical protein
MRGRWGGAAAGTGQSRNRNAPCPRDLLQLVVLLLLLLLVGLFSHLEERNKAADGCGVGRCSGRHTQRSASPRERGKKEMQRELPRGIQLKSERAETISPHSLYARAKGLSLYLPSSEQPLSSVVCFVVATAQTRPATAGELRPSLE